MFFLYYLDILLYPTVNDGIDSNAGQLQSLGNLELFRALVILGNDCPPYIITYTAKALPPVQAGIWTNRGINRYCWEID